MSPIGAILPSSHAIQKAPEEAHKNEIVQKSITKDLYTQDQAKQVSENMRD
jgi:hypothetical protein